MFLNQEQENKKDDK